MNKKYELKKKLKENRLWIIGTIVFLIIGVTALLIGFNMTGWSIMDWLQSPWATTFFIVLALGLVAFLVLMITLKEMKNGNKYDK